MADLRICDLGDIEVLDQIRDFERIRQKVAILIERRTEKIHRRGRGQTWYERRGT